MAWDGGGGSDRVETLEREPEPHSMQLAWVLLPVVEMHWKAMNESE